MPYTVVVPTIGRGSLTTLVENLARSGGPPPAAVVVVDDRARPAPPLLLPAACGEAPVRILRSGGRGPAAARNTGWRAATTPWVVFLDDDVLPGPQWRAEVAADLAGLPGDVGGVQGRVEVPLTVDRRPTDRERSVKGLERARWVTADMAYRRTTLDFVGGFDERFRRAFREDADLGLRVTEAGFSIERGARRVRHPVQPAPWWVSLSAEAGNADDVLMRALHGRRWRRRTAAGPGGIGRHAATSAAAVGGVLWLARGRRALATASAVVWAAATGWLIARRVRPGPKTLPEVGTMVVTSLAMPFAATWHRARGTLGLPALLRGPGGPRPSASRAAPAVPAGDAVHAVHAVLFDRDGTLVEDEPYNGDPDRVRLVPGARAAVDRARAAGLRVGVVTNQSGVGRGLLTRAQLEAVNARVEQLLGPIDVWCTCLHAPEDGCGCRKPRPGLITAASDALGVPAPACVVIGDIGADVEAAQAAGARGILVPNGRTRLEELRAAPESAHDVLAAVELAVAGVRG